MSLLPGQAVVRTVGLPVTWDVKTLMWRRCNTKPISSQRRSMALKLSDTVIKMTQFNRKSNVNIESLFLQVSVSTPYGSTFRAECVDVPTDLRAKRLSLRVPTQGSARKQPGTSLLGVSPLQWRHTSVMMFQITSIFLWIFPTKGQWCGKRFHAVVSRVRCGRYQTYEDFGARRRYWISHWAKLSYSDTWQIWTWLYRLNRSFGNGILYISLTGKLITGAC